MVIIFAPDRNTNEIISNRLTKIARLQLNKSKKKIWRSKKNSKNIESQSLNQKVKFETQPLVEKKEFEKRRLLERKEHKKF